MTALDKSFTLTVSLPVIFCSTSTYLLFSRVGNPFLTLRNILYIHSTPYNGPAWKNTLSLTNLSHKFPNLVHDITYSSPLETHLLCHTHFSLPIFHQQTSTQIL